MVALHKIEEGVSSSKEGWLSSNRWGKIGPTVMACNDLAVAFRKNFMFLSLSAETLFELAMQCEIMECTVGQTLSFNKVCYVYLVENAFISIFGTT